MASAAGGAGTMAFFSDTESSTDNTVQTGTLDLALDGSDETVTFLSESGIEPGDQSSEPETFPVQNTGTLPGKLTVEVTSVTSYENGLEGSEEDYDSTGGDPGPGKGELQNHLTVSAGFQNRPDLWTGFETASSVLVQDHVYDNDYVLDPAESDTFEFSWQLPESTGQEAQSDSLEFALTFRLTQTDTQS